MRSLLENQIAEEVDCRRVRTSASMLMAITSESTKETYHWCACKAATSNNRTSETDDQRTSSLKAASQQKSCRHILPVISFSFWSTNVLHYKHQE